MNGPRKHHEFRQITGGVDTQSYLESFGLSKSYFAVTKKGNPEKFAEIKRAGLTAYIAQDEEYKTKALDLMYKLYDLGVNFHTLWQSSRRLQKMYKRSSSLEKSLDISPKGQIYWSLRQRLPDIFEAVEEAIANL